MPKRVVVFITLDKTPIPAGLLQFVGSGRNSHSFFRYGKRYIEREDAISIDPVQLPLGSREIETPTDFELFNGVRDAGPDKWGRYLLEKRFERSLDELDYVLASSQDRSGALSFGDDPAGRPKVLTPAGFVAPTGFKRLDLGKALEGIESALLEGGDQSKLEELLSYGPSIGGARPKTTVVWNGKLHIAKFSTSLDRRNEALVEYAAMSLAKKCGLNVPSIEKTRVSGRDVYLIERFDRTTGADKAFAPIPFISGLTATGAHERGYSDWSYRSLADAITRLSSRPKDDKRELFRRLVFNILVFNNDDHLRNHGFLHAGGSSWNLSPLYDVVPTTMNSETYALSLEVGAQGKAASPENALSACPYFDIGRDEALSIMRGLMAEVSRWRTHFEECGLSRADIGKLENSFRTLGVPGALETPSPRLRTGQRNQPG